MGKMMLVFLGVCFLDLLYCEFVKKEKCKICKSNRVEEESHICEDCRRQSAKKENKNKT